MNHYASISSQVLMLHEELRQAWPHLKRIAIALYDASSDELHTFANATEGGSPLAHYSQCLSTLPSLKTLAEKQESRIVDDLEVFRASPSQHSQKILQAGFRSSYTVPMFQHQHLLGFIFYDADEKAFFTPQVRHHLQVYSELIESLVISEVMPVRMVLATIHLSQTVTSFRDEETAAHMGRMAHYARLIAVQLAERHGLDDEFINHILLFAPLHDIGKIGVPDHILLKPGKLTTEEFAVMQTHVNKGMEIIDTLIREFDLDERSHIRLLRNIIAYHHEHLDGSGYPHGLKGDAIPLESRIAAVADVFDALISERPYHRGRPIEAAFEHLQDYSGRYYDPDCVTALISQRAAIEDIQALFRGR